MGSVRSAKIKRLPDLSGETKNLPQGWQPGQSGNPKGRPPGIRTIQVLKNDLELAVRGQLTASTVTKVVNKMAAMAIDGDVKAAKLILDMAISKNHVQDVGDRPQFHIVIENATIAAQKEAKMEHSVILDIPKEIK